MTKIFCVYFDERPLWRSDCIEPIQAGRARTHIALDMLGDDTGDNISEENLRYGEMTAWYWVWKNYLPEHPEVDYIGFSHYRRFLDFAGCSKGRKVRTTYADFRPIFEKSYVSSNIEPQLSGFDIVMRKTERCKRGCPREEFVNGHPLNVADWDRFEQVVRERNPEASVAIDRALGTPRNAQELQFVMKREVFVDFMTWAFGICRECERRAPWGGESDGARARTPAFLVERFFMVYLEICRARGQFSVKELAMIKLTGRPWWYRLLKLILPFVSSARRRTFYDRYK